MKDYFSILFLSNSATLEEVKQAYRKLAKKFHPDSNNGNVDFASEFIRLKDAYEKILLHFEDINKKKGSSHKTSDEKSEVGWDRDEYFNSEDEAYNSRNERFNQNEENNIADIKSIYKIGDKINVGYFIYEILKVSFDKHVGLDFFKVETNGLFVIIEMLVTNLSKTAKNVHNYMYRIVNSDKDYFEFSVKGISAIQMSGLESIDIFGTRLNPKMSLRVNIVFEVSSMDELYLLLCGGEYNFDENSICHCDLMETVRIS